MIIVNWPRDMDHYACATHKAYRDNADVRKEMTGWQLTTVGLDMPKALAKQVAAAPVPTKETIQHVFSFHRKWQFKLSGVALLTLAEAYNTTVDKIISKSLNATHFLKMAAKAKSSAPAPAPLPFSSTPALSPSPVMCVPVMWSSFATHTQVDSACVFLHGRG